MEELSFKDTSGRLTTDIDGLYLVLLNSAGNFFNSIDNLAENGLCFCYILYL